MSHFYRNELKQRLNLKKKVFNKSKEEGKEKKSKCKEKLTEILMYNELKLKNIYIRLNKNETNCKLVM